MRNRRRTTTLRLPIAVLALLVGAACTSSSPPGQPVPPDATGAATTQLPALDVERPTRWVCRPGLANNPCAGGLDAEIRPVGGGSRTRSLGSAPDPQVDCFYVYPTVSDATGPSAPRRSTARIEAAVRAQAGLFGSSCRLFAPVYRQATAASLRTGEYFDPAVLERADSDVRSAWHDYLNEDNDGRGVVLIGHSQGAMALQRLLGKEILQDPAQRSRIVSALLIGGNVPTSTGSSGSSGDGLVPCEVPGQLQCVIAYNSFAGAPPATAFFGRAGLGPALCTDPTRLSGLREGSLHPYLPTAQLVGAGVFAAALPTPAGARAELVGYPGSLTARCRAASGLGWLDVGAVDAARTPRLDGGAGLQQAPQWGLHVADVNLALGDLVEIVRLQGQSWSDGGR